MDGWKTIVSILWPGLFIWEVNSLSSFVGSKFATKPTNHQLLIIDLSEAYRQGWIATRIFTLLPSGDPTRILVSDLKGMEEVLGVATWGHVMPSTKKSREIEGYLRHSEVHVPCCGTGDTHKFWAVDSGTCPKVQFGNCFQTHNIFCMCVGSSGSPFVLVKGASLVNSF